MQTKHLIAAIAMLSLLLLPACSRRSNPLDAGVLILKNRAPELISQDAWWLIDYEWQNREGASGSLDNERIPSWAADSFHSCIYWEDDLEYTGTGRWNRSSGLGKVWGWILVDQDLNYYILEIGFIDASGEEHALVNAWEEPGNE
ncbi:hypothetical protein ACFLSZ_01815 [Candidatus Bipolaricaulota bacterium]